MSRDDDLRIRPGRIRSTRAPRTKPFITQALAAAEKAGGVRRRASGLSSGRSAFGRGRSASLRAGTALGRHARQVTVKARVVRHGPKGVPLAAHLNYLRRDGVTRDGAPGQMFDAEGDDADHKAFAKRCEDDRHHFRFIVSPEDASELADLRAYTRDLMATAERDLGTRLDWIAVDHWNTEHPHVHVLVRGRGDDGQNLVISRDYIGQGLRARASERATLELGSRTEQEIRRGQEREVEAERWTELDRQIAREAVNGVVDLRPRFGERPGETHTLKVGRMRKLEGLGIAEPLGPAQWRLPDTAEASLRDLQLRGDIIKRLHRAMSDQGLERSPAAFVLDGAAGGTSVLGRLSARGLDDELAGSAFVVIDGVDGRAHHVRLPDLEAASDAPIGAVVEARWTEEAEGKRPRLIVSVRSDLSLEAQVTADGVTWLDRQLVGRAPAARADSGFGRDVEEALQRRVDHLAAESLARRQGRQVVFARDLLATLKRRELDGAAARIAAETGLAHQPAGEGEHVAGVVRRRVVLASGRFAMLDDGMGFQLVPWSDPLEKRLGQQVSGVALPGGGVDWSFGRKRGLGIG
ncbi:relaxase/mobilization nuclease domain-containing protein [Propylenella binzhouense]|uniref:DUF3363 domain-containing protein n=1 Tax=Propylenella binzhouense TaxID=2555902 RepID=A0A964T5V7_9HYPH|nr:VirD2 family relaxase/mobilization nuclease [Propylenella binzhouense]MYZ49096.1 DUF3363 domain-containing protein [Propylenella binzhouense]